MPRASCTAEPSRARTAPPSDTSASQENLRPRRSCARGMTIKWGKAPRHQEQQGKNLRSRDDIRRKQRDGHHLLFGVLGALVVLSSFYWKTDRAMPAASRSPSLDDAAGIL